MERRIDDFIPVLGLIVSAAAMYTYIIRAQPKYAQRKSATKDAAQGSSQRLYFRDNKKVLVMSASARSGWQSLLSPLLGSGEETNRRLLPEVLSS